MARHAHAVLGATGPRAWRGPGWSREQAAPHFPRLVSERSKAWWSEREARERPRRGNGWNADAIAQHIGIEEHWLEACFGPNKRKRCGLVSVQRPGAVRQAEQAAQKAARRKAKRTPRAEYEANSEAAPGHGKRPGSTAAGAGSATANRLSQVACRKCGTQLKLP